MRLNKLKNQTSPSITNTNGRNKIRIIQAFVILSLIFINSSLIILPNHSNLQSDEINSPSPKDPIKKIKQSNGAPVSLRYGIPTDPGGIDPHLIYMYFHLITQVCEGLFTYNLSDPKLSIIPNLASSFGTWSSDRKNYTIPLRQNILFHDGTPFNASTVKWSFDRLNYFMNVSGTLPPDEDISGIDYMYRWSDGTPFINKTEIIDEYTIKFVLNRPFMPLLGLLCFSGSYILSPTSTPLNEYINLTTGDLIGTGPYVYDSFTPGKEVILHAFENYWKGKANIDILNFSIIKNYDERNSAILSGEIDILHSPGPSTSYLDKFEADPEVMVENVGSDIFLYLGMNNQKINLTMRKAISYSINYSYLVDDIMSVYGDRLRSPIPEGILYANSSFDVPTLDVIHARTILVDAGVCNFDIYDDSEWINAARFDPIETYNFTYWIYSQYHEFDNIQNDLEKIGIKIIHNGLGSDYWDKIFNQTNELDLFWCSWGAHYNDPDSYIRELFSNVSESNFAQVNDPWLQNKIEESLKESNERIRETIFDDIQQYIIEDLMPLAYCCQYRTYGVYRKGIKGYHPNVLEFTSFYGVSWEIFNIPFDNMVLNYSYKSSSIGSGPANFLYTQISGDLFHIDGFSDTWSSWWDVNPYTRIVSDSGGEVAMLDNSHTFFWIFTDINIGDNVLISVAGEGDHNFEVSGEKLISIPGYGNFNAWELIDLTEPGGIAFYDKNTGLLLNGTFLYRFEGIQNYTFTLNGTNAFTQAPNIPSVIDQYKLDGITQIPESGTSNENNLVFKGIISDPDGDDVRLEIELREFGDDFTGIPTSETISKYVSSGTEVNITRYGLSDGDYKWQYRVRDEYGAVSDWTEFGVNGNIDFEVNLEIGNIIKNLQVPYIHQLWDTPDDFNGGYACGATSALMALAFYERINKWPCECSQPDTHVSNYGNYICRNYTFNGYKFDTMTLDASNNPSYGAYGYIHYPDGLAKLDKMINYFQLHGFDSYGIYNPSEAQIKTELDLGYPVPASTKLTGVGHWVIIKGYTDNGYYIVNDPYGNMAMGGYDGADVLYTWDQMKIDEKWAAIVHPTLDVSGFELKRRWIKNSTTTLPCLKSNIKYTLRNIGTEEITNTQLEVKIDGNNFLNELIPSIPVGEEYTGEFTLYTDYDKGSNIILNTTMSKITNIYNFSVYASLPRAPRNSNQRLFITPQDPVLLSVLNNILEDKSPLYPDWMAIRDWVGNNIVYTDDTEEYGVLEYYQLPKETISKGEGDCEDFSLLLVSLLRANGWDPYDVYVVIGQNKTAPINFHAWVRLYVGPIWYNIEPQYNKIALIREHFILNGYKALYIFNDLQYEKLGEYIKLNSPGELRIFDSQNRLTGLIDGNITNRIPFCIYDNESKIVGIFSANDSYRYQVVGTDEGNYGLKIVLFDENPLDSFEAIDIPISIDEIHQFEVDWITLSEGKKGILVKVDSDGDGIFDYSFYSDGELTEEEFDQNTRNPPEISGYEMFFMFIALIGAGILTIRKFKQNFEPS